MRVAAARTALSRHSGERRAEAGDVAQRVVAATLAENGAAGAAAALPGGAGAGRTQVAIIGEMVVGQRGAGRRLEIDVADITLLVVAQRR